MSAARKSAIPAELDIYEIAILAGYSSANIHLAIKNGTFPPPDRIGGNRRRLWKKSTVLTWLQENEARVALRYRKFRAAIAELEMELGMN